jgi:hypothetical protein
MSSIKKIIHPSGCSLSIKFSDIERTTTSLTIIRHCEHRKGVEFYWCFFEFTSLELLRNCHCEPVFGEAVSTLSI